MKPLTQRSPVQTADELAERWREILGDEPFADRCLWLTFFDLYGFQSEVLVPIHDLPDSPETSAVDGLALMLSQLAGMGLGMDSFGMLLSRPGGPAVTAADEQWGRLLSGLHIPGLTSWPIHLGTEGLIRRLWPDARSER